MPHTLAQKIMQAHTDQMVGEPGQIVQCRVDMVLANDITAPLAIKSFQGMEAGRVFDPAKVALVMDHFTPNKDIASAEQVKLVREFARAMCLPNYYEGGQVGVEHALLPELGLVGPGDVVVGADSHTCTYGGLGALATGMGSTDIAAAMALGETWFKVPPTIRVEFTGTRPEYLGGKDLILFLIGQIGVDGALYRSLEFTGPVVDGLDIEERMTIANMAIEAGAKFGLFGADQKTLDYTASHGRKDKLLQADPGASYERSLSFDVSGLSPQVACPHLPENVVPVEDLAQVVVDQVVIGSCTNGRISDLRQAAAILKGRKTDPKVRTIILPATPNIWRQALADGLIEIFMESGCVVGPATCGPCLGGHMGILAAGETALSTTNRNFRGRMGSLDSQVYLCSPAVAAASALTGRITHPAKI